MVAGKHFLTRCLASKIIGNFTSISITSDLSIAQKTAQKTVGKKWSSSLSFSRKRYKLKLNKTDERRKLFLLCCKHVNKYLLLLLLFWAVRVRRNLWSNFNWFIFINAVFHLVKFCIKLRLIYKSALSSNNSEPGPVFYGPLKYSQKLFKT
jgi:hypothetical protein